MRLEEAQNRQGVSGGVGYERKTRAGPLAKPCKRGATSVGCTTLEVIEVIGATGGASAEHECDLVRMNGNRVGLRKLIFSD